MNKENLVYSSFNGSSIMQGRSAMFVEPSMILDVQKRKNSEDPMLSDVLQQFVQNTI